MSKHARGYLGLLNVSMAPRFTAETRPVERWEETCLLNLARPPSRRMERLLGEWQFTFQQRLTRRTR